MFVGHVIVNPNTFDSTSYEHIVVSLLWIAISVLPLRVLFKSNHPIEAKYLGIWFPEFERINRGVLRIFIIISLIIILPVYLVPIGYIFGLVDFGLYLSVTRIILALYIFIILSFRAILWIISGFNRKNTIVYDQYSDPIGNDIFINYALFSIVVFYFLLFRWLYYCNSQYEKWSFYTNGIINESNINSIIFISIEWAILLGIVFKLLITYYLSKIKLENFPSSIFAYESYFGFNYFQKLIIKYSALSIKTERVFSIFWPKAFDHANRGIMRLLISLNLGLIFIFLFMNISLFLVLPTNRLAISYEIPGDIVILNGMLILSIVLLLFFSSIIFWVKEGF